MNWHYEIGEQVFGPVSSRELRQLKASQTIGDETLVLCTGLPGWVPYREACPESVDDDLSDKGQASPASSSVSNQQAATPGPPPLPFAQSAFAASLAGTHPKASPSVPPPLPVPMRSTAGFWIRFAAKMLDGLIICCLFFAITAIYAAVTGRFGALLDEQSELREVMPETAFMIIFLGLSMTYSTLGHGLGGATLGKKACSLRVVALDNSPITIGRAWWRYMAELIVFVGLMMLLASVLFVIQGFSFALALLIALFGLPIMLLGYVVAAFTKDKRGLHDYLAGTKVIRR